MRDVYEEYEKYCDAKEARGEKLGHFEDEFLKFAQILWDNYEDLTMCWFQEQSVFGDDIEDFIDIHY